MTPWRSGELPQGWEGGKRDPAAGRGGRWAAARRGGCVSRRELQAVGPRVWSRDLWGLHVWERMETRGRRGLELPGPWRGGAVSASGDRVV